MTQLSINLTAGQLHRLDISGRFFMLTSIGAASSIYVRLDTPGRNDEELQNALKGTKIRLSKDDSFKAVFMRSAVNATVEVVVSENDVDYSFLEGANVNATITNPIPVPVSNDRGSPGNLLYVSGVSLADAPATSIVNSAAVACGPAAAVVAAANANRRAIRFANLGPDPVALGAAGITWAARCIVLEVGDVWIEDRAANLAWSAITDAAKSASVTAQQVIA